MVSVDAVPPLVELVCVAIVSWSKPLVVTKEIVGAVMTVVVALLEPVISEVTMGDEISLAAVTSVVTDVAVEPIVWPDGVCVVMLLDEDGVVTVTGEVTSPDTVSSIVPLDSL